MKTKKLKQFSLTKYYRGVELEMLCVTSSQKKFADLAEVGISHVTNYANKYEPRDEECIKSPDTLFARPGIGGEAVYIFKSGVIYPLDEYKRKIDEHRKKYSTYGEFYKELHND